MQNPSQIEEALFDSTTKLANSNTPNLVDRNVRVDNASATGQSQIGKTLSFIGELCGSGPLHVDGKVDGDISLPGGHVTIGPTGRADADIRAREIVVLGRVHGNLLASDLIDIRAEGTIIGSVSAVRIIMEEGAFFKGRVDTSTSKTKPESPKPSATTTI
jgi:cytoskeletal protein CcmA (bactofilin family)